MADVFEILPHLNGPKDSANGGIVCGEVAIRLAADAEVTLRRPPPLGEPITVARTGDGLTFHNRAGELIVSARRIPLELDALPVPDAAQAEAASQRYAGLHDHAFPSCFTCGPARRPDEALRLAPGPLHPDTAQPVACLWTPHRNLAASKGSGVIDPRYLVAAIDCPGAWAIMPEDEAVVLGRMHLSLRGAPRVGEPCVVMGWALGRDGRKYYAGTSAHGRDGRLLALSRQTWIALAQASGDP